MDIIDKFYVICEYHDDNLMVVALALKKAGAKDRPYRILKNIESLFVSKYETQIDIIIHRKRDEDGTHSKAT